MSNRRKIRQPKAKRQANPDLARLAHKLGSELASQVGKSHGGFTLHNVGTDEHGEPVYRLTNDEDLTT